MFIVINYTNGLFYKTNLVHNKDNEPQIFNTLDEAESYGKKNLFFKFQVIQLLEKVDKNEVVDITEEFGMMNIN